MKPTINQLINSACAYTRTPRSQLLSCSRVREIVKARDLVIWNAVKSGHSFSHIGRVLGRDHTSIIHSAKKTGAHSPTGDIHDTN